MPTPLPFLSLLPARLQPPPHLGRPANSAQSTVVIKYGHRRSYPSKSKSAWQHKGMQAVETSKIGPKKVNTGQFSCTESTENMHMSYKMVNLSTQSIR